MYSRDGGECTRVYSGHLPLWVSIAPSGHGEPASCSSGISSVEGSPPPRTVKDSNTSDAWRSWSIIPTWTVSLVKVSIVGLISLSLEQRFSSRVEHPNHSSSKKQKTKTRFPSSTSDYGFGIPGCPRGRSCADRMGNVASWNHPWVTRGAGSGWEWASFEDRGASF